MLVGPDLIWCFLRMQRLRWSRDNDRAAAQAIHSRIDQAEGPDFDSAVPDESWKQIAAFLGMPVEFEAPQEQ